MNDSANIQGQGQDNRAVERSAMFVATLTSFMGPFLISSVNVALPAIQSELGLNAVQLSWIATAYLLAVAVGLVPAGKVADIHGRKKIFATGLGVYVIGAVFSIFAGSAFTLIFSRVVQGLGAAMFVTTGMAIITSIFPPHKRGRVIGLYVAAVYVGLSVGPFVGGILTQYLGWRSIFVVTLPMGVGSLLLTLYVLKGEWRGEAGQQLDLVGCFLYAASILSLVYGASRLPAGVGVVLTLIGFVLLAVFIMHQKRARFPVFEVNLFAENKRFAFSSFAALLNYSATFSVTFLLSLYLQYIKGMTPQAAGTILMAQPVIMAFFSPAAGRLADRIEPRYLATAGMAITVLGVFLFRMLDADSAVLAIIANLVLLGFGFALFSSPNMSAIMGSVEKRHYGLASGVVATMRLLGQMGSMAVAMVVLTIMVGRRQIEPSNYGQFLDAIHVVFAISAFSCLIGVYFSWFRGEVKAEPSKQRHSSPTT